MRTFHQEEELSEKRAVENKNLAVTLIRQELITRLETVKLRATSAQISPGDINVVLIAAVRNHRLIFPWEDAGPNSLTAAKVQEDLDAAASFLRKGNHGGAFAIGRRLLKLPPSVTDEYGIPFAIYAARMMDGSESPLDLKEIRSRIENIEATAWLSPAALYMTADVSSLDQKSRDSARARGGELEGTYKLSSEIPVLENNAQEPLWLLSGDAPWLVSMSGRSEDPQRNLVVVRARKFLDSVKLPGRSRWVFGKELESESLGEGLQGIRIAFDPASEFSPPSSRRWFFLGAIILGSLTAFSGWLLNRDIRREARLAILRSQFVSSISHELKTPVATIHAYAELIDMGRVKGPEATSEYLKTIMGESERLSRLVDGVLEFSKIEQGNHSYRFAMISLEDIARSAARAVEYPIARDGFQLCIEVEAGLPLVCADRDAIEQAIVNLLSNAIKYSGDNREIGLSLCREGGNASIRVWDRGIGIDLKEQARIFESFYRAPLSEGRHIAGTGLGLTLVDHIVKAHHGRVVVESQLGQGSTFSILLPLEGRA